jgi:hypothetical protein
MANGSSFKFQVSGFRFQVSRFKVQGSSFKVQGSGFRELVSDSKREMMRLGVLKF